jgi:Putative bacterial sensory transduction regulator
MSPKENVMRRLIASACLAIALSTTAAQGADAVVPQMFAAGVTRVELTKVLTSHGMTVQDATENETDPWLKAKTPKGTEFYVNMYDCTGAGAENRRCSNLQFLAQWELSKRTTPDIANLYNQKFVFGRAYMAKDGKTFMFDYSINIKEGVSLANLKKQVDNWLRVLDDVRGLLKV